MSLCSQKKHYLYFFGINFPYAYKKPNEGERERRNLVMEKQ